MFNLENIQLYMRAHILIYIFLYTHTLNLLELNWSLDSEYYNLNIKLKFFLKKFVFSSTVL